MQLFSNLAHRLLGISAAPYQVGEEEIRTLIAAGAQSGAVEAGEADLLEKVFRFGDRQMREVMTPRPEIIWLEQGVTLADFLPVYNKNSHTRFPVYANQMENVVGVLSVKDVLSRFSAGRLAMDESVTGEPAPGFLRSETKSVGATFQEMRQQGRSVVLTVDEFGGIAGLATIKQLLEVIVGQVDEEDAAPDQPVRGWRRAATGWTPACRLRRPTKSCPSPCPKATIRRWPGLYWNGWAASPPWATRWNMTACG